MQRHDLAQLQSAIAATEEVGGMEEAAVMKEAKVRVVHASFMLLTYGIHAHVRIITPRSTNERMPAPLPSEPFHFVTDACSTTHSYRHPSP